MSLWRLSPIGEKTAVKEELDVLIAGFLFGALEGIGKLWGTTQQHSGWEVEAAGSALWFRVALHAWRFYVMWLTRCQSLSLLLCKVTSPLLACDFQNTFQLCKDAKVYRTYGRLLVTQMMSAIFQECLKKYIVNNLKLPLDALNYAALINKEHC